jgi:hypothetical protein
MLHHDDLGDYRQRARTMSPSVLKKLRRVSLQEKQSSPRTRPPTLSRNHSLQDNSKCSQNDNLLISILKKRECTRSTCSSHSSTEILDEEIENTSREAIAIERNPLPRGSVDFEAVMTELGVNNDEVFESRAHTDTPSSPGGETVSPRNRKVHWNIQ